jgi:isopentenyldiphosphate isomerase
MSSGKRAGSGKLSVTDRYLSVHEPPSTLSLCSPPLACVYMPSSAHSADQTESGLPDDCRGLLAVVTHWLPASPMTRAIHSDEVCVILTEWVLVLEL